MVILSKLADYGVIISSQLAAAGPMHLTAVHLAHDTRLPATTVAKVLKLLAKAGIVTAVRGATGGYRLARAPERISVAEIIAAIDGAFGLTECTSAIGPCDRLDFCPTRPHWRRINQAVEQALERVTLSEMAGAAVPAHSALSTLAIGSVAS
jgi:FeS assembly SUF system regulator